MSEANYYIVDTSSLIDLNHRYPIDIFPGLWTNMENLIKNGLLISPEEVLKELKDDSLKEWAKKQNKLFKGLDPSQIKIVSEILEKFPSLAKPNKDGPQADPFVIALAISAIQVSLTKTIKKRIIVTEEKLKGNEERIPFICQHYNIECISVLELFRTESWEFH